MERGPCTPEGSELKSEYIYNERQKHTFLKIKCKL